MDNTNTTKGELYYYINGEMYYYTQGMSYREFCDKNPSLETRVDWDETVSEAVDAYYDCKKYVERTMGQ